MTRIYMTAQRAVMLVKRVTYFGELGCLNSSCIRKSIILLFLSSSRTCSKTQLVSLLVSRRHAGAHPDEDQHGVSIPISINLGKKILCISCMRKTAVT